MIKLIGPERNGLHENARFEHHIERDASQSDHESVPVGQIGDDNGHIGVAVGPVGLPGAAPEEKNVPRVRALRQMGQEQIDRAACLRVDGLRMGGAFSVLGQGSSVSAQS